jgi:hypothetical protein
MTASRLNRLDGDPDRGRHQHHSDDGGSNRLGLAVSPWMFIVGVQCREPQPAPDNQRTDDVGQRFDGVGEQGKRVAEDSGHSLPDREPRVDEDPRPRRADPIGLSANGLIHA